MVTNVSIAKKFVNLLMVAGGKDRAHRVFFAACYQFQHLIKNNKELSSMDHRMPNFTSQAKQRKKVTLTPSVVANEGKLAKQGKRIGIYKKKNWLFTQIQIVVKNAQPSLEGRRCRVAGTTRLVPAILTEKRGHALAMRWIVQSARKRKRTSKNPFYQCLAQEFLEAYQGQGGARLRRDEYHKACSASRGYLRYRWW